MWSIGVAIDISAVWYTALISSAGMATWRTTKLVRGKSLVWDFTCWDTYAPSHLASTSARPGSAALEAAVRKIRKYDFLAHRFTFIPVAMETSGVWDQDGLRFVREVGVRVAVATGEKRAPSFLLQRLSLAVQRGNVTSVLGCLPYGDRLDEILEI